MRLLPHKASTAMIPSLVLDGLGEVVCLYSVFVEIYELREGANYIAGLRINVGHGGQHEQGQYSLW